MYPFSPSACLQYKRALELVSVTTHFWTSLYTAVQFNFSTLVQISKKFGISSTSKSMQKMRMIHMQKCSQETPRQWTKERFLTLPRFVPPEGDVSPSWKRESLFPIPGNDVMWHHNILAMALPLFWAEPWHSPSFLAFIADQLSYGMGYPLVRLDQLSRLCPFLRFCQASAADGGGVLVRQGWCCASSVLSILP